jgi:hypothetical protein
MASRLGANVKAQLCRSQAKLCLKTSPLKANIGKRSKTRTLESSSAAKNIWGDRESANGLGHVATVDLKRKSKRQRMCISGKVFPKQTLPGSVHIEWKRCNRSWCRCSNGVHLHGPYFYRRWRENGQQKKVYVTVRELREVIQAVELRKQETMPVSVITTSLARAAAPNRK